MSQLNSRLKLPNARLLEFVRARGWTYSEFARQLKLTAEGARIRGVSVDPKTIHRWMSGEVIWPQPHHRQALENLFGCPAVDLGFIPPWVDRLTSSAPADSTLGTDIPWTHLGSVSFLLDVTRSMPMDVDRRGFVALAGVSALVPASTWLRKDPDPATAGAGSGSQVDSTQIALIQRRIDDLRLMDDDLGGGDLYALIIADLKYVTARLKSGRYSEKIGKKLHAAAAELSRLAGWVSFDAQHHKAAQMWWEAALRSAHTSGDWSLGAHILTNMGNQTYNIGSPQNAVALIETAQAGAKNISTSKVKSILAARLARAHCKNGDARACLNELDQARDHFSKGDHPDDPSWTYYLSEAELGLTAGSCHLELGHHDEAVAQFTTALDAYGDTCHRDRSLVWGRLATAHLKHRDLDHALDAGGHALALIDGPVRSVRSTAHIRDITEQLDDHASHRGVQDFLDQAQHVLARS
jgi:tetratricopeptide (TPR) repeat protein